MRDVYIETSARAKNFTNAREALQNHMCLKTENLSCQRAPDFPYLLIKLLTNSTTWLGTSQHLPKPQAMQWVIGEAGDFVHSKTYHQFLFIMLLTRHQRLLQREKMGWSWERTHHNPLLIRDLELQKHTSRVYKAKYHTFFHITAIVLWIP